MYLNEPFVPLTLVFCQDCSLVQITETVFPEVLFCNDYIIVMLLPRHTL